MALRFEPGDLHFHFIKCLTNYVALSGLDLEGQWGAWGHRRNIVKGN